MTEHENQPEEATEEREETVDDLEVGESDAEDVKGGAAKWNTGAAK